MRRAATAIWTLDTSQSSMLPSSIHNKNQELMFFVKNHWRATANRKVLDIVIMEGSEKSSYRDHVRVTAMTMTIHNSINHDTKILIRIVLMFWLMLAMTVKSLNEIM